MWKVPKALARQYEGGEWRTPPPSHRPLVPTSTIPSVRTSPRSRVVTLVAGPLGGDDQQAAPSQGAAKRACAIAQEASYEP